MNLEPSFFDQLADIIKPAQPVNFPPFPQIEEPELSEIDRLKQLSESLIKLADSFSFTTTEGREKHQIIKSTLFVSHINVTGKIPN